MELQHAFYIIAIIYMGVMFLLILAGIVAVFIIKAKINAIHRRIDEKLAPVLAAAHTASTIAGKVKDTVRKKR